MTQIDFWRDLFDENRHVVLNRIFSLKYLTKDIENSKLTLVEPTTWEDPFEGLFTNARIFDHEINSDAWGRKIFGQCWSKKADSDALWRIYSTPNEKDLAKLNSKASKLRKLDVVQVSVSIDNFVGAIDLRTTDEIMCGFVNYLDNKSIENNLIDSLKAQYSNIGTEKELSAMLSLLFSKRDEFSHEEEFRILSLSKEFTSQSGALFRFLNFDWETANPSFLLSPWVPDEDVDSISDKISSSCDWFMDEKKIAKSKLYESPTIVFPEV